MAGKSKYVVAAIGTAVVAAGAFAAYTFLLKGPSGDASGALASAKIIPDEAVMAGYITTDPKAWAKIEQFGTPETQRLFAKSLEEFNKSAEKEGYSYEKDIKPWVGGIMFAVLPPSPVKPAQARASNKPEPELLMVIGIKDKIAALNFTKKVDKRVKTTEIEYKGLKITESISQTKPDTKQNTPSYTAILDNNYVVYGTSKRSVEQAIDTFKGEPSLLTKQGASTILSKGADLKNTVAQFYIPDYAGMIDSFIKSDPELAKIPPKALDSLKQVKSMVVGFGIDDAGIRMKATANLDPKLNLYQYEPTNSKIVSILPAETLALINGQGVNRWWDAMLNQSKDFPELQTALGAARTYTKYANIDLDKEVFAWMDGEFALAAIPSNKGLLAQTGFGGALVFDTKDDKTAKSMFAKLDSLVKTQNVSVKQRNVGGKEVTEWNVPNQGAVVAHGWLDQDTVFVALGSPIADVLTTQNGKSLESDDSFKTITSSLQKPNGGYFYLDMDKTMVLVDKFATGANAIDPQSKAFLSSIRGVSMTATSPDKSSSQVEMLLSLKPKAK
ncbi:metalloendopeptidase [Calothrix sp. HK-06]|nr:metalloendopeptidase [Calothrix sp. HK-06]